MAQYLVEYGNGERRVVDAWDYEYQTFETDDPPTILRRVAGTPTTPHADRCESCASTAPARRYRYTYDPEAMDEVWRDQTSVLLCDDCYDFAYTSATPIDLVECDAMGEEL